MRRQSALQKEVAILFTVYFADVWYVAYSIIKCCSSEVTQVSTLKVTQDMKKVNENY